MAEVKLYKKDREYTDGKGEKKHATNYYLQCGSELIPIQVTYFGSDEKPDKQYAPRRAVLSAFAEDLPPLEDK